MRAEVLPLVEKRGNTLRVELDPGLDTVVTDPTKLRQILLGNASKFTQNGSITLQVERVDAHLRLVVHDTGMGIPADRLEAVFDAFEQDTKRTQIEHGGTGLGLPLSRRLARLLGGDVRVASIEGEGSTFTVTLPWKDGE